jgi:hypothetical protein
MSNPNLADPLLVACFERKGLFSLVSDDSYRSLLFVLGDNPRLAKPYDDRWLDGAAQHFYQPSRRIGAPYAKLLKRLNRR